MKNDRILTRSAFFLCCLGLKTVVSLVPEDYPKHLVDFYSSNGITLKSHGLEGNKWPFKGIDEAELQRALDTVLDTRNRPILIHCNKGKHRTGTKLILS